MTRPNRSMEFRPDDDHSRVVRLTFEQPADAAAYGLGSFEVGVEIVELRWRHGAITLHGDNFDGRLRGLGRTGSDRIGAGANFPSAASNHVSAARKTRP